MTIHNEERDEEISFEGKKYEIDNVSCYIQAMNKEKEILENLLKNLTPSINAESAMISIESLRVQNNLISAELARKQAQVKAIEETSENIENMYRYIRDTVEANKEVSTKNGKVAGCSLFFTIIGVVISFAVMVLK